MSKDYSYGPGQQVRLDARDRAKNTPAALSQTDYPLDVVPDQSWPGTQASSGGIQFDPEAAEQVAAWLDQQGTGPLADLPSRLAQGTQVSFGPPTWQEAKHLQTASTQVSQAVTKFTTDLLTNLTQASQAIRNAKQNYASADHSGQHDARSVNANIGYSPATPPAQQGPVTPGSAY